MNRIEQRHLPSTANTVVPFLLLLLLLGCTNQANAVDCGNCFCSEDVVTGYQNVICLGVPFAEIRTTFAVNMGLGIINRFNVVPQVGDSKIPALLLGIHRARIIHLASCGSNVMEIDINAFRSSSGTTQEFAVYDCDVKSLIWSFLDGFSSLNLLQLEGATNIQSLGTLPSLPSLQRLSITNSKGFGPLNFPGSSLSGLQNLIMTENTELNDGKVNSILSTLGGAKSLEMVSLKNNPYISSIPSTLASLVALHSLDLSLCNVNSIPSGSLSFSNAIKILDLSENSLSNISDDAFEKGYYGNAKLTLDRNQMTEFRSTVFLEILTQMRTSLGTPGTVSIKNNPVKCNDCQMAWLIRDYRELLSFVSGSCSNATEFQDLNPSWYDDQSCEALTTTEQPTTNFEPITTTDSTTKTVSSTMSESTTATSKQTSTGPETTVDQLDTTLSSSLSTDPNQTTNPTSSNTSGITTSSTGSQTGTGDSSSTTKNPNGDTTTPASTPSTFGSSTAKTPNAPAEINYDMFFYILYGVLGGIAIILIFGFIFLDYKRRKALRASASLDVSSSRDSSLSRQMDPESHDPRVSYLRMPEPRPPSAPTQYLGNHPQSRNYSGPVSITTPYQQQNAKNLPPPPSGRVRGLRRF